MPSETRYMRGDQHTVNGLTAYVLGTTQSATEQVNKRVFFGNVVVYWGIRVWKRASDGTETEITAGTPIAQVSRATNGEGIQSATWDCPETSLSDTDAIVIRVYIRQAGGPWYLHAEFITEQLGATKLNSATWTVYYYTYRRYNFLFDATDAWFYWGTTDKNSRIENFTWSVVTYTLTLNVDKTQGYINDVFTFYGTLTQNKTPISGATVTLYKDGVSTGLTDVTDSDGNYSIPWTADEVGSHNFYTEAVW